MPDGKHHPRHAASSHPATPLDCTPPFTTAGEASLVPRRSSSTTRTLILPHGRPPLAPRSPSLRYTACLGRLFCYVPTVYAVTTPRSCRILKHRWRTPGPLRRTALRSPSATVTIPGPAGNGSTATPKLASAAEPGRLLSTWSHRAWVGAGCASLLVTLAKSIHAAGDSGVLLEPLLAAVAGYVLADLGSGVYHWGVDNYGDPSTPIFGAQIEAFQGHHRWPWIITRRQFANNVHALGRAVALAVLPFDLAADDAVLDAFAAACGGCVMFSQQFHAWAHGTKSRLPPLVAALQDAGVLVSRAAHAAHHRPPYDGNYCIVSGVWNEFLDEHRVFEAMELVIYFGLGVRPRSWSEPESEQSGSPQS